MKLIKKSSIAALLSIFALTVAATMPVKAETNPFAVQDVMTIVSADDEKGKCGEGKCGEGKMKDKAKDAAKGKCGEGKCGESKMKDAAKGKCGEGKAKDAKEGKCGE
tara:strand:+ start:204 stop:524 length:321 start_codon:yes stop_codon:yes gene_type:complete